MKTYAYGFPRLGKNREFKKAVESFWKKEITEKELLRKFDELQEKMLAAYEAAHIDFFPVGEMTAYDQLFDAAVMSGLYRPQGLEEYYKLCRGKNALEMTKWFDTNYHYLVPDLSGRGKVECALNGNCFEQSLLKFKRGLPFAIGPFTLLKLSKGLAKNKFAGALSDLAEVYARALRDIDTVHIEEPALVMDLSAEEIDAFAGAYKKICATGCRINLITYYGPVDCLATLYDFPFESIGLDFVHGKENFAIVKNNGFPRNTSLVAGVVDGRNVWRGNVNEAVAVLYKISVLAENVIVSNAGPLYHLPVSLEGEKFFPGLAERLSFAVEKLYELRAIAWAYDTRKFPDPVNKGVGGDSRVRERMSALEEKDFVKTPGPAERRKDQDRILGLPLFPLTTIGSFPQTAEVRKARADRRGGRLSKNDYSEYVKAKIKETIFFQENAGLDVLVHGEFERTDMVEFFAQNLDGIATSRNGWIISYGTRGYRPPIIFSDVSRPGPMTVNEIKYAQSLTKKPVKGMLTGAVTIIAWSFVRRDIPLKEVAYQISLCLRDEILDYEKAGIKIVQIDEPAFREKAPIRKKDWPDYFDWAIKSFNLATNTDPKTQIHTHMCYAEFTDIIEQIDGMDFDVISIEAARSRGDIIAAFEKYGFKKQIGLGVWDIHSPAVPSAEDMTEVVERSLKVIPKENFWINPDCGLKTRDWPETEQALTNLVETAKKLRKKYGKG